MPDFLLIKLIFDVAVLISSVVVHEVSHGAIANALGDPTAKYAGRLTLNPLKHLDPFGSFLLPVGLALLGLPPFGWANPVPYNPQYLKNPKVGTALIALAGPLSNLCVASILGLSVRFLIPVLSDTQPFMIEFLTRASIINIFLALFNLVPLPPLDGSKIAFAALPGPMSGLQRFLDRWGVFGMALGIVILIRIFAPLLSRIAVLLVAILTGRAGPP